MSDPGHPTLGDDGDSPPVEPPTQALTRRTARELDTVVISRAEAGQLPPEAPSGIAAVIARHPRAWIAAALGVAFLVLGTGAIFAGIAAGSSSGGPVAAATPTQTARPVPAALPAATPIRTCSVASQAADAALEVLSASVINASTGEVLFDRSGSTAASAASIQKILTSAAALTILGPDYRMSTRVYDGSTEGSIVLVGGGDPTISALPAGEESVYAGAPKLDQLASTAKTAYEGLHPGVDVTTIVLDSSLWSTADKWDPTWNRSDQTNGYMSEVTALQVDGDRADPTKQASPRTTDPVQRAGDLFADAWGGLDGVTFTTGSAVATKPLLAEVQSQPMSVLIDQMVSKSDGSLAESIARLVSKQMGLGGSAASLQQAIPSSIAAYGVPTTSLVIKDGSGLSAANGIPPLFVAQFSAKLLQGDNDLDTIYNALAISGQTGGLKTRFTDANAIAVGAVHAKVGTLSSEHSLGGIITAADGTQLAFAFYAIRAGIKDTARTAIDTLATAVYSCGNNLSNN